MINENKISLIQFDDNRNSITPIDNLNGNNNKTTNAIKQLAKSVLLGVIGEIFFHFVDKASVKNSRQGSGRRNRRRNKGDFK